MNVCWTAGQHLVYRMLKPLPPMTPSGMVKYWVSAGRGGFGLSSSECVEQTLYCVCTSEITVPFDRTVGMSACASPIAPKPAPFGTLKSTNYLQNVLAKMQAEEAGLDVVSRGRPRHLVS